MAEKTPLVEAEVIRDTFVTGIGDIQIMGTNARITLYVDQGADRIVVAKLVVPLESIPSGIKDIVKATWGLLTHTAELAEADRAGRH